MQVKELMTREVKGIGADATVRQAARQMAAINVGALPVARDQKLVGMLTDRDITVRVLGENLNPDETAVEKVMTPEVFTLSEDQDVSDAGKAMRDKQVRRAPVLNSEKKLVGIVSLGDLAVKSGDPALSGEVLKGVSEPAAPKV